MCGLAGCLELACNSEAELSARVMRMTDTLAHRGPDDEGMWVDGEGGLALGFRRLAIVDLSAEGHQPMRSESGRYVMIFNGEVYNFGQLRQELEPLGHRFRGHSDTEVMLAAIEQWGLEAAVQRFVGMFAFAIWDRQRRRLSLVRDRLGIKPLYYGWMGQSILFGSELKALRAHPGFEPEIDREALTLFLRYQYVPAPYSIYRGIHQLPPGCILNIDPPYSNRPSPAPYWSARAVAEYGTAHPFDGSEQEAIEELDRLLREAVRLRMIADVPLGAFLSGGVDSSTVVALMQAQSQQPVKTFSIGFHEAAYNEAPYARAVAEHLGTDHTELYVTPAEAQAVIPQLPHIYDEPFSDSSQIPTFLVSQLTRTKVTVSLSGDGGDELFGGYQRYAEALAMWKQMRWLPGAIRRRLGSGMLAVQTPIYDHWLGWLSPYTRRFGGGSSVGHKLHRAAEVVGVSSPDSLYHQLVSHWRKPGEVVVGGGEPLTDLTDPRRWANLPQFMQRMMYLDIISYLPHDILTKVDRASMAVSLEARVPLLDHRVVEFAWRLPLSLKVRNGQSKWILRQLLDRYVPRSLIERPKMGFGIPIDIWLRGPLREWAEELLDERRLRDEGFFHPEPIRTKWTEHLSGRRNWQYYLWDVLVFQGWLEHWESPAEVAWPLPAAAATGLSREINKGI